MYIRLIAWQTQRVIVECQFDILPCESAAAFARGKANAAHFGSEGRTTRGCALNRGVVLEVNSRRKNLLEFQALQGFARLSEATIRKVCEEMKWTISASPTGADEDHHLAVVGMLNLDTSLTEEEVVQRILHRQESDKLTPEADDQELEMIVRDTLLSGEQDQALKELTRRRTTVAAKSLRPKVQKMYQRAAMDVKGWLDKKAVEARKLKEKSVTGDAKAFDKNIERVYAQLNASGRKNEGPFAFKCPGLVGREEWTVEAHLQGQVCTIWSEHQLDKYWTLSCSGGVCPTGLGLVGLARGPDHA